MKSKNRRQLSRRQFLGATAGVAVAASGIGPEAPRRWVRGIGAQLRIRSPRQIRT